MRHSLYICGNPRPRHNPHQPGTRSLRAVCGAKLLQPHKIVEE